MRFVSIPILVGFICCVCTLAQCRSSTAEPPSANQASLTAADLQPGLSRWQATARAAGQTYFYWRVKPAGESEVREITGVQIRNGVPVRRLVNRARYAAPGQMQVFEKFNERHGQAGATPAGFPAQTMEQLYARCGQVVPKNSSDPQIDFGIQIDARGVLTQCYALEKGCHGDCARSFGVDGIVLREISAGEIESFLNTSSPVLQ